MPELGNSVASRHTRLTRNDKKHAVHLKGSYRVTFFAQDDLRTAYRFAGLWRRSQCLLTTANCLRKCVSPLLQKNMSPRISAGRHLFKMRNEQDRTEGRIRQVRKPDLCRLHRMWREDAVTAGQDAQLC